MNTFKTGNRISNIDLSKPITQTKHMVSPTVSNQALILLYTYQNGAGKAYSKKELVGAALGHIDYKYIAWPWSDAAFCNEFAAFNYNGVLQYDKVRKKWAAGPKLKEYIEFHFGPASKLPLNGWTPYDAAKAHNALAATENADAREKYKLIKAIGEEFFFQ